MNVIDFLEQTPERVRILIAGQSEEALSFKPSPDEFSLRENVLHLRDIDVEGYEVRITRILSEVEPVFPDVNGAALARERNYNAQPVAPALNAFAASRARSIARLRAIAPADLERTGELEGAGRVTLQELLDRWAQHDREHLAEMSRCLTQPQAP
jgi:hypothetical protein